MAAGRATEGDYLSNLPVELIFAVADYLADKDLYCLALGNGWLSQVFNIELKRRFIEGSKTVALAGNSHNTLFLTKNGSLYACGANRRGEHGRENRQAYSQPYRVKNMPGLQDIHTPKPISVFFHTKSGDILTSGSVADRKLFSGVQPSKGTLKPFVLPGALPGSVRKIYTCGEDVFFLMQDGSVYSRGHNHFLRLGLDSRIGMAIFPKKVSSLGGQYIEAVFPGSEGTFFINTQGRVFACGSNEFGSLGLGGEVGPYMPTEIPFERGVVIKSVASSGGSTLFLDERGRVYACGRNEYGQLGLGHFNAVHVPKRINGLENIAAIFMGGGGRHAFFVTASGQLFACGDNRNGRLGLASLQQSSVPMQVEGPEGVTQVKFIYGVTLFLQASGDVLACGVGVKNFPGMAGVDEPCSRPVKVPALESMSRFFNGGEHGDGDMLIVRQDGTVMAWGNNPDHILGLPEAHYSSPTRVVFPEIEDYLKACSPSVLMVLSKTGNDFYYQFTYQLAIEKLKSTPSVEFLDEAIEERVAFLHYLNQTRNSYLCLANDMQSLFPGLKELLDKAAHLSKPALNGLFHAYAVLFTLYSYVENNKVDYTQERAVVELFKKLTTTDPIPEKAEKFKAIFSLMDFPRVIQSRRVGAFRSLWGLLDDVIVSDLRQAASVLKAEIDLPGLDQVKRKPEDELPEKIQPKTKKRR